MTQSSAAGPRRRPLDRPILLVVIVALATGILAGLARIGYQMPAFSAERAAIHGPLLAAGVLGTLIGLERAVAFGWRSGLRWHPAYIAPAASALGTLWLLIAGMATIPAQVLLTIGAAGLVAVNVAMVRTQRAPETVTMALGAVLLLIGNAAWLAGRPTPLVVHWWVGFLVLTIVGERLEIARIRRPGPNASRLFTVIVAAYLVALVAIAADADVGIRLSGLALLALAAWLLRFDVAWLTIHNPGLPRFVAICLLAGYGWLVVGGALALTSGLLWAGLVYDALLHALLLGFVFSMILGHAPIIIPAILGLPIGFHVIAYLPLVVLQLSTVLRVAGDLLPDPDLRMLGGLLAAVAILLEAVAVGVMVVTGRRARAARLAGTSRPVVADQHQR
jgi:hypothetical protein